MRAFIGAIAAAVAMFVLGFVFYATPLAKIAYGNLDDAHAASVQQALAANLPHSGTFVVPDPGSSAQTVMYGKGPVALVHYNMSGFAPMDVGAMIAGFVHMVIVGLLMAFGLAILSRWVVALRDQVKLLVLAVLTGTVFMHLGDPIWFHQDWQHAIYVFFADSVELIVAGLIILKLLPLAAVHAASPRREEVKEG
jgi:hypothetical protein